MNRINVFPSEHRGKAIGILSMVQSAGLVGGPALGGFIIDIFDWPAIFYTRIPVGIIGLGMAPAIIEEQKEKDSRHSDWRNRKCREFCIHNFIPFFQRAPH